MIFCKLFLEKHALPEVEQKSQTSCGQKNRGITQVGL